MSVPKSKRGLSDLEFYKNAMLLRLKITNLLLRDFGVKDKIRNLMAAQGMKERGIEKEDYKILDSIFRKYDIGRPFIERYPKWMLDHFRVNILELLKNLIWNITAANTIYPIHETEVYERRRYQTRAIVNCEQLLQEMQYIIYVVPSDINKLMPYVEMILFEIKLLKGWRKGNKDWLKRIKEKESGKDEPAAESDDSENASKKEKKSGGRKNKKEDLKEEKSVQEETATETELTNQKEETNNPPWKVYDELDKDAPSISGETIDPDEVLMGEKLISAVVDEVKAKWKKSAEAAKKKIRKKLENKKKGETDNKEENKKNDNNAKP